MKEDAKKLGEVEMEWTIEWLRYRNEQHQLFLLSFTLRSIESNPNYMFNENMNEIRSSNCSAMVAGPTSGMQKDFAKVHGCPASNVMLERIFSVPGNVFSDLRNKLVADNVLKLV